MFIYNFSLVIRLVYLNTSWSLVSFFSDGSKVLALLKLNWECINGVDRSVCICYPIYFILNTYIIDASAELIEIV